MHRLFQEWSSAMFWFLCPPRLRLSWIRLHRVNELTGNRSGSLNWGICGEIWHLRASTLALSLSVSSRLSFFTSKRVGQGLLLSNLIVPCKTGGTCELQTTPPHPLVCLQQPRFKHKHIAKVGNVVVGKGGSAGLETEPASLLIYHLWNLA